jgi:hypothetical protein
MKECKYDAENAKLKREILITTKLPLGVAFGDLGPLNRTSYSL